MKRYLVILLSFMLLLPVQTVIAQVSNVPKPPIDSPTKPTPRPRSNPRPRPNPKPKPNPKPRPNPRPYSRPQSAVEVTFSCNVEDVPVFIAIDGKQPTDIDEIFTLTVGSHKVRITADGYATYNTCLFIIIYF